ncbi:MAG: hypothetical protein DCC67_02330, partial [Planctomycetota bacterium]
MLWLLAHWLVQALLVLATWVCWLPRGKDTLIVYSRSPHCLDYFEARLIPQLSQRATTLNWSDRAKWPAFGLSSLIFRAFAGSTSFNPMVMHFKLLRWPKVFRFFEAFRNRKHGQEQPLQELEKELVRRLGVPA